MEQSSTGLSHRIRRLALNLCFGLLAAIAILTISLVQLLDELRVPHCLTAPVSLAALFAPCAPR